MAASAKLLVFVSCLSVGSFLAVPPLRADAGDRRGLAGKVHQDFKSICYRCHGESGANEGGFNYLLNRAGAVVSRRLLIRYLSETRLG
jgi:hypothetical protein